MSISVNQRVSQLVELTSTEVQPDDLFLIIDITARESKKIKTSELIDYLQGSGSLVLNAESASYVLGSEVDGIVTLAQMAYSSSTSLLSSQSLGSISSSYSTTASFALNGGSNTGSNSSSYLIYSGTPNGTASYAIKSNTANVSSTTNFLSYFGGNNGTASYAITTQNVLRATNADTASYITTASYAITTQNVLRATNADTASYINESLISVGTASFAQIAQTSNSSSYLIYSVNNGTASYAMSAKSFANAITDQGIFLAITQSLTQSQLDDVDVLWSTTATARTPIEAVGTIIIPFTSSIPTNGTLYLATIDRNTGFEKIFDSTPISFILGGSGSYESGSIKQTFSLMGQENLYGSYLVFVSASNNIQIDSSRTTRFNVSSESDTVSVHPNGPISFDVSPSNSATFSFTSTDGGPFMDNTVGLLHSMSLGKKIYTLNATNQSFTSVNYFWTLNNVTESNFSNNTFLISMSGIPNSLTYFSCSYCNISSFYDFSSSSLSVFDCHNNQVLKLPNFPSSMSYLNCSNNNLTSLNLPNSLSYLNCSNNNLTSLPVTFSYGLNTLFIDNNDLTSITSTPFPNSVVTLSLNNNTFLSLFTPVLPLSLSYFSMNNCPVSHPFPDIPQPVTYLSVQSCSLLPYIVDNIILDLTSSGMLSGTVDVRGNGMLSAQSILNMGTLQSLDWTTLYDT